MSPSHFATKGESIRPTIGSPVDGLVPLLLVLVDKPELCITLLEDNGYLLSTTNVIAIKLNDHPDALYKIPKTLGDKNINIDYCYSTLVKDNSMLIVRVEDDVIEEAVKTLQKNGFTIFD